MNTEVTGARVVGFDMPGLCQAIAESSPMPMAAVERGTHLISYANPAFCALLAKPRNEVVGHRFPDIVPVANSCSVMLDNVFQTGNVEIHTGLEETPVHPLYWAYAMWPIIADSGSGSGSVCGVMIQVIETTSFHRQVTAMNEALLISSISQHALAKDAETFSQQLKTEIEERKGAYAALEASDERFSALYKALPVAAFVCNQEGIIVNCNTRAIELWGREPEGGVESFWGTANLMRLDGSRVSREQSPFASVLHGGVSIRNFEVVIERPDGSHLPASVNVVALKNAGGQVTGAIATFDDISERLRIAEDLTVVARKFTFLTESLPQKIFTARPNGEVDYVNKQWLEYSGWLFEEFEGWGWKKLVHPEDLELAVRDWLHSIDTGKLFEQVHRFRRADGQYHWHLTRVHAMRDAAGAITMWIGSNTDIQEQKELEAELRWANDDLKQFAFAASHDLLQPLRTLTNYSQLLIQGFQGQLNGEAAACVAFITQSALEMRTLLQDLLAYTEAGGDRSVDAELIDLNQILAHVKRDLTLMIAENHATVITGPLPTVCGHEARFVQLFQNLIVNAIKYRSALPPQVQVSATRQGDEWLFAVTDNGMGIESRYFEKIFGVFKRLHGKSIPGTGIGLAICQRIVDRYGGKIWVESQIGQGTVFYFTLAIAEESTNG